MKIFFVIVCVLLGWAFSSASKNKNQGRNIVYYSSDDGESWSPMDSGLPDSLFLSDIATDGETLALSTKQHGIYLYDFKGKKWLATLAKPHKTDNVNVVFFYKGKLLAGTENKGIFLSADSGRSWMPFSTGLNNQTIRRLTMIGSQLYAGTNAGLYHLDESQNKWIWLFGHATLQVNGIAGFRNDLFIATNKGLFKSSGNHTSWHDVMPGRSLHNISADDQLIYAQVYGDLVQSADHGASWNKIQEGLPPLYTFHVKKIHNTTLAGQWDGVYKKTSSDRWVRASKGLPEKFPAIEMLIYKDLVITASSGWVKTPLANFIQR